MVPNSAKRLKLQRITAKYRPKNSLLHFFVELKKAFYRVPQYAPKQRSLKISGQCIMYFYKGCKTTKSADIESSETLLVSVDINPLTANVPII